MTKVQTEPPIDSGSAPFTGGSAATLDLLVFGDIAEALKYPGPSVICIPDKRMTDMLDARRSKCGAWPAR